MSTLYHILGANIEPHNQTLLQFFQREIVPNHPLHHRFYVVGNIAQSTFPMLDIVCFPNQRAITRAVIKTANAHPSAQFLLHGQFNVWIWLAILCGKLSPQRLTWHIWGADLYESSKKWTFRLFYPIRRIAQKQISRVWATRGDLHHLWTTLRPQNPYDRLVYFPTKLTSPPPHRLRQNRLLTILVGNSGDPSNQHLEALKHIYQQLGQNVRLIIPMGYPPRNEAYIHQVEQYAKRWFFSENVQILRQKLDFADYQQILSACDLGYFNFERQQGIGTICLLIQHNIPIVLHPHNPFCLDMQAEGLPVLTGAQLTLAQITQTQQVLTQLDKRHIHFFPPNYAQSWLEGLSEIAEAFRE